MMRHVDAPKDDQTVRAGLAIRAAREAKGLSQTQLRDLLRDRLREEAAPGREQTVGQSAVSRWEKGVNAPEHWKWRAIEEALDMEPGSLAEIILGRAPAPVEDVAARLDAIEATMAEILRAVRAADRRLNDQGT